MQVLINTCCTSSSLENFRITGQMLTKFQTNVEELSPSSLFKLALKCASPFWNIWNTSAISEAVVGQFGPTINVS